MSFEFNKNRDYFLSQELEVDRAISQEKDPEQLKILELQKQAIIEQKERKLALCMEKEKEILMEAGCKKLSKSFLLNKVKVAEILQLFGKTKYLSKDILKKLQKSLKKTREMAIKDLKFLLLPSGLIKSLMGDLMKARLSQAEIRLLTRFLRKLMINFFKKPFLSFDIKEIKHIWLKLPLSVRRLIMAIMILKQEMIHKFSLDLEKAKMKLLKDRNDVLEKKDGLIQLTEEQRRFLFLPDVWIRLNRISGDSKKDQKKYKPPLEEQYENLFIDN